MALGTGEALVSFLDEDGVPTVVEKAKVLPPQSKMGPAEEALVSADITADEFDLKYRQTVDRESAYEIIARANEQLQLQKEQEQAEALAAKEAAALEKQQQKELAAAEKAAQKSAAKRKSTAQKAAAAAASSVARSLGTNMINTALGGKVTSASVIGKRAASSALSSVMRSGSNAIVRGLFDIKK